MTQNRKHFRGLFIISIILLIINDIFLKSYYSNFFTGKLSDVAGLFAFPYFLSLLFPEKVKLNYFGTAILFILWKSEIIQPILVFFQSIGIGLNRTIDYSDLVTLLILPISYLYWNSNLNDYLASKINFKPIILSVCSFAFIATSLPKAHREIKLKSNLEITLKAEKQEVINKLKLEKVYGSVQDYNYVFELEKSKSEITSTIKLIKQDNGLISIKLDSILESETRGSLFFGVSKDDTEYLDKLTIRDYEKIFLEKEITKLYEK
ncbi:hypothetical protein HNQ02_003349 [Flavobacterium sp. 7E]|uniref:hypothetical protein n=1 Tax=Flavobacterium sp. 7E TaxID=2735898 RepID=UPI00156EFA9C|nr:hypothetical protein [Flavobacterium sp. 7E]NRS90405.1 hypothetical protein [Flavobacterium sp. 7E]